MGEKKFPVYRNGEFVLVSLKKMTAAERDEWLKAVQEGQQKIIQGSKDAEDKLGEMRSELEKEKDKDKQRVFGKHGRRSS